MTTGVDVVTDVTVDAGEVALPGALTVPEPAAGAVVFVHGSGSSRHSTRNRQVAAALSDAGFATLLFDLLTEAEETVDVRTRALRFDIPMLSRRVVATLDWLREQPLVGELPVGLFGASTGAAAALVAAAARPETVAAVVSRGGRPDLAADVLGRVRAPTLLLVGGRDDVVIALNRDAAAQLTATTCELRVVPGATHLFEEPGALETVADAAAAWFDRHLAGRT